MVSGRSCRIGIVSRCRGGGGFPPCVFSFWLFGFVFGVCWLFGGFFGFVWVLFGYCFATE